MESGVIEKICAELKEREAKFQVDAAGLLVFTIVLLIASVTLLYFAPIAVGYPNLIDTVAAKLLLLIFVFYIAKLLLNVVRYNIKLANRYRSIRWILTMKQATPHDEIEFYERLFDVDGYVFLDDKVINVDLLSRLKRQC